MSQRNLVAFYSMSGNTRALANEIRDAAHAHLEEIVEPRPRRGLLGVARALFDSLLRREPPIEAAARDPSLYELLILGGPVWAGRIAAPVRSYARKYGSRASRVAFFCTQGGNGADEAFAELAALCGRPPETVLAIPAASLASKSHSSELQRFIAELLPSSPPAAASPDARPVDASPQHFAK